MGYAFMLRSCGCCDRPFIFNPMKVPAFKDANGVKQPVCGPCLVAINKIRKERGMSHDPPLPGAYEPCDENEFVF